MVFLLAFETCLGFVLLVGHHRRHSAAMSDSAGVWKSEEQKSLRELSGALISFAESQAQIKCMFSLYDHDSDGLLTTNQTQLLMRKLGYSAPKSWDYIYRDAVTLPLVSDIIQWPARLIVLCNIV